MKLYQRTIRDLHQMLVDREISSVELTDAVFNQINAVGDKTKAYLLVTRDLALRQAKAADERLRAKRDVRPLTGIPIALKDVLCVKDVASTAGSKILQGFIPPYSATVVERLEREGAVFLGKTNCDEFAMGSSNENSGYRPVHNPRDSTSSPRPVPDYLATLTDAVKGMRLGVPKEYFVAGMEPAVEHSIRDAIRLLEQQGASIEEVSLPHSDVALPAYYIIAPAEASSNLGRYDGMRYGFQAGGGRNLIEEYMLTRQQGFGAEVKRRIMLGTYALSSG